MLTEINLRDVTRLVRVWQKRLGLDDWKVSVELMEPCEAAGYCEMDTARKAATISVSTDHSEYLELVDTVVHELCHMLFWWLPHEGPEGELMEQALHRLCPVIAGQAVALNV